MVKKTQKLEQMNLNFDDPSAKETELHQKIAEEIQLSELYEDVIANENVISNENVKYDQNSKYFSFLNAVKNSGINVENIFSNISTKKKHLKNIMGYECLIGKDNKRVPLDNAKESRIGKAYLNTYNLARRAMKDN